MVTFTGLIERDDVADFVAAFDVALQPAVRPYESPLKLFEHMALGCAIVAPDTANIREALLDEETAVLFDPDTPGSIKVAVERVCTRTAQAQDVAMNVIGLTLGGAIHIVWGRLNRARGGS